jgi:hypothetical protein
VSERCISRRGACTAIRAARRALLAVSLGAVARGSGARAGCVRSLRLPQIGIAAGAHLLRGYITTQRTTTLRLVVAVLAGAGPRALVSWSGGHRVRHRVSRGTVSFRLSTVAGRAASRALSWG